MTKQEEVRKVIDAFVEDECLYFGKTCEFFVRGYCANADGAYKCLMKSLDGMGVVIRGGSLGGSHPHLANYFTVESIIKGG